MDLMILSYLNTPKVSVITPTHYRPQCLLQTIHNVRQQTIRAEHVVVSDGFDNSAKTICKYYGVKYDHITHKGQCGAAARDRAIEIATGEYCVFWDDDVFHYLDAVERSLDAVTGYDLAIVSMLQWEQDYAPFVIPTKWTGQPIKDNIDSMNFVIKRNLAKKVKWAATDKETRVDFDWIDRIWHLSPKANYSSVIVGEHLGKNFCDNMRINPTL
jgi:glycosyltransferase involved in cell wall biosynthesis